MSDTEFRQVSACDESVTLRPQVESRRGENSVVRATLIVNPYASSVTEEFREKLQLMRSARGVVEGAAVGPVSSQPLRGK